MEAKFEEMKADFLQDVISMTVNSLHAMGTFMCLYKIEKTMYFILMSNKKAHINSHKPYGCIKIWLGKIIKIPTNHHDCTIPQFLIIRTGMILQTVLTPLE